ncbi:MAG: flagellar filament capping protein FliD [Agathobacter sp.]|nr:flagellar filament capping protein FliD [Agathobacter sp.]
MAIRLSGLTSGMDTDAIVQELVSAYSKKTEKYEKQQTKLTWKQDAWKGLNTKIYSLYTNVSNMRMSGSYNLRKTSVSDNTKATVTANSDAVTGTQSLNILKTAQASYITGAKLGDNVTADTKLSDLGYKGGDTSFEVEGKDGEPHEIKVTKSTTVKEVIDQLKEVGLNASFDATNKRIFISAKESGEANDFNLVAGSEDGNDVLEALGLNTALLDEKGNFINGAEKYKEAYDIFLKAQEKGLSVTDYINQRLQDYEDNKDIISDYKKLEQQLEARKAHNAIFNSLKEEGLSVKTITNDDGSTTTTGITSFQLRDMEKALGKDGKITKDELTKYVEDSANGINGVDVDKLYEVLTEHADDVKKVAAYANKYDDLTDLKPAEIQQKLADDKAAYDAAVKDNEENEFIYLKKENDTEEKLNNAIQQIANDAGRAAEIKANAAEYSKGGATKITGQDAVIELNGVEYTSSTNGFVINGLTINAQAVTTDGPITITTNVDSQAIYDKIKDFLTEYNNVINEMTKLYNAESASDYEPLTDEEKEAMSEEQIEKWEDKIKGALLRRDGSLNSIMSTMINSMSQSFEVDGVKLSLGSFGISTLGFLNSAKDEQYAFHIDGDEDDENTSGKKDKLMKAIEENPDQLMGFMQKLMGNLYENIDKKMKSTELSSAYKVYNDKEMDKEATRIEQMIKKWEDKISDKEEYYYDKFTQMEVALSKLQNQTSSISGLLGGMQ